MRAHACVSTWWSYLWQWFLIDLHGQHDRSSCAPVVVPMTDHRWSLKDYTLQALSHVAPFLFLVPSLSLSNIGQQI